MSHRPISLLALCVLALGGAACTASTDGDEIESSPDLAGTEELEAEAKELVSICPAEISRIAACGQATKCVVAGVIRGQADATEIARACVGSKPKPGAQACIAATSGLLSCVDGAVAKERLDRSSCTHRTAIRPALVCSRARKPVPPPPSPIPGPKPPKP
jgi:hypothetical protein